MGLALHHPIQLQGTENLQAVKLQQALAQEVRQELQWGLVTGVVTLYDAKDIAYAVAVSLSASNWRPVEIQRWSGPATHPFQMDLLSFRVGPPMVEVLLKLHHRPDVIFVDGDGQAHPRKFGPACHVGISLDHPTIGVSTQYPFGVGTPRTANFAQSRRGNNTAVMLGSLKVGYELVSQDQTEPIYVSVGNRLGLEEAVTLTLKAAPFYGLPEPLRQASLEAVRFRDSQK